MRKQNVELTWDSKTLLPLPCRASLETLRTGRRTPSPSGKRKHPPNRLIHGDNLAALNALLDEGYEKSAGLIYIDPPYLSNADYHQKIKTKNGIRLRPTYSDKWTLTGYLDMLYPRLHLMRKLLNDDGKIFVQCDWRASPYIRLLCDEIFGVENFLNEIIWHYGGRGAKAVSGQFPRNHDTIYAYGKTKKAKLKKLYFDRVMTEQEALSNGFKRGADGRFFKTAMRGDYTDESIKELEKKGRIYTTASGNIRIKYFLEAKDGRVIEKKLIGDVWDDIPDSMHSPLAERTGFKTQKPERLIKRVIECATREGDLVCDFFSGSGTTAAAAEKLKRRWIACEVSKTAVEITLKRLRKGKATEFIFQRVEQGRK